MKIPTAVAILLLAVSLTGISSAQTIKDKDGTPYTCRATDGSIYTMDSGPGIHVYNIKAAKDNGEPKDHGPICISPMMDIMKWKWPGEHNIEVHFTPLTTKTKVCNSQPFRTPPGNSNEKDSLESDVALNDYSYCAYKLNFTSTGGSFDPHIIIKGYDSVMIIEKLEDKIGHLENELREVKKELEQLEKEQKKDSKHQEKK